MISEIDVATASNISCSSGPVVVAQMEGCSKDTHTHPREHSTIHQENLDGQLHLSCMIRGTYWRRLTWSSALRLPAPPAPESSAQCKMHGCSDSVHSLECQMFVSWLHSAAWKHFWSLWLPIPCPTSHLWPYTDPSDFMFDAVLWV